jgi:ribosomal protein S18 acetylase RimI-like enzyme
MSYRYQFLSREQFPQIHGTFREAFADYYVDTSGMTETVLYNRAVKNGVDFEASVGAFEGDRMVAVTVVGLDQWKGAPAAFDIATGVVPGHRGKGVAGEMFEFASGRLRERGVARFVLEVIQENEPAIKAYEAAGFRATREFDCFHWSRYAGAANNSGGMPPSFQIQPVSRDRLAEFETHVDWRPSWENSFASIRRIPDAVTVYGAFDGDACVGLLIYYPLIGWITTLVVKRNHRRRGVATALLEHCARERPGGKTIVKVVNVDHRDTGMLSLLKTVGFELLIRQYEMELEY